MDPATIIKIAASLLSAYTEIRKAAEATGMTPTEFDAAVAAEQARVDAWVKASNAAEDAVFDPPDTATTP